MKKLVITISLILFYFVNNAQSVAINNDGSTANTSSILDIKSTAKGILIPRMSKAEKNAIATPPNGLLIYQNAPDSVGFHYYNGAEWLYLLNHQTDSLSWKTKGNYITGNKFIGTLNDSAFKIRVNNQPSGIVDSINQNTSLGFGTLRNLRTTGFPNGMFNAAIGYKALDSNTLGYSNNAIGVFALRNNTIGADNTAMGSYSQINNKKGNFNSSFGNNAMFGNVMGSNNVALGNYSLYSSDSASNNVAIGQNSLRNFNDVGNTNNIAIGSNAMYFFQSGTWNSVVGAEAMNFANNTSLNSAIGFRTLKSIIEGGENNTLGVGTMEYKDTALSCVAIGRFALSGDQINNNSPDTGSIAIGTRAGRYNNVSYNTFIGYESGIGSFGALGMTGKEIVSIGSFSLNKLSTGSSNSTFGYAALFNNTTGNGNIGIGTRSLFQNRSGKYNVAIGDSALYGASTNIGDKNIGVGAYALRSVNASANNNVAVGDSALQLLSNGNSNIAIGSNALSQNVGGVKNIAIGLNAGYNETGNEKLYIENSNANKDNALIYGDFATDSLNLNAKVNIRDYTRLGTQASGAPAIKMKKLVIPVGPPVDSFTGYALGSGITDAKVIGVQVMLNYAAPFKIPPSYNNAPGYEYDYQIQNNQLLILLKPGNSANIGLKSIVALITYEE